MGKPDLLTKAKALAILQHPDFDALWEDEIEEGWTATAAGPASSVADSPLKALALLADALGLEPDPDVVVLTAAPASGKVRCEHVGQAQDPTRAVDGAG